ncbi:hypothetical protein SAMN02800687_3207 [Curtobacterium sp. UNCCL20]|uniref:hypothetical protein n=1 Tax=Curtobacterium sp. UNCCL20 TaxID=1502773 RepID=UPI00088A776A|nr:hypothetical protein [Curtobacterium sp. UNCCL20]SDQ99412.1 hypothetical protein SAMN02800687_3207 [Curtobacterium sp. UNCCL20]
MNTAIRRPAAALLAGIAGGVILTGCTGGSHGDAVPEDYTAWMSQTSAQMNVAGDDEHGGAGGRLTVENGDEKAGASVSLEYDLAGPYDVLAVCRSSKKVHLTVSDYTAATAGPGESLESMSVLGQADITCGVTSRIPIDVPKGRAGITLDASTTDRSGQTLFDAFVVTRGAGQ